jgi:hypothetical protein
MSYDIAVIALPISELDAAAWQELDALLVIQGEPGDGLRQFHGRLIKRYPCLSTLSDEELDGDRAVWSDGSLLDNFGLRAAVLAIQHPKAEVVVPFVVELARSHGASVFDWSTRYKHRRLLLQIDTADLAQVRGEGTVYFIIRNDDLALRELSQVHAYCQ